MRALQFLASLPTLFVLLVTSVSAEPYTVAGVVHPRAEVTLKSKVHGEIRRIFVKEGQRVKKGDVLMEFDNDREKALLELAEARARQTRAALDETRVILSNSQKDARRQREASDVVPRKLVEDAEDLVRRHEAAVAVRIAEIAQAEAEIKLRRAELEDTVVHAPFHGVVTELIAEEGEVVKALEVDICEIVALDELHVEASLPAELFRRVRLQGRAEVRVDGSGNGSPRQFKGAVFFINPVVDATSKTFKVKVKVLAPDGQVRPGMTAELVFP